MPPELLEHQFEQDRPSPNVIDVNNPEQVAYLLPSEETDDQDGQGLFIAINPLVGSPEEVNELTSSLQKDLDKDLRKLGIQTEKACSPLVFADKNGIIDYRDSPEAEAKAAKMIDGEIPGEIHPMKAIKVTGNMDTTSNPLFAEATAALIGRQLEARGRSDDAWLENLTTGKLESVCIKKGEYSLPQAITSEHHIPNLDRCIREETISLAGQYSVGREDAVIERPEPTAEVKPLGRFMNFIGHIASGELRPTRTVH